MGTKLRAGLLVVALLASCALLVPGVRAQSTIQPVQCALTSSVTTCTLPLLLAYQSGQSFGCGIDTGGTWSGQLDFVVSGLETPAAASGFQPNTNMSSVTNTTSNGFWQISVNNASEVQVVVDTPGSFTGTANVGIRCSPASFQTSNLGQVARNVTVVSPLDGSGYVETNCKTGCAGGQTFPTSSPGNAQLVVPANASAQPYTAALPFPVAMATAGAGGWAGVSVCHPATTSCAIVANTNANIANGNAQVVAAFPFWYNGTNWQPTGPASPLPVTTPAPVGTIGVVQQAAPLATTPVSLPTGGAGGWVGTNVCSTAASTCAAVNSANGANLATGSALNVNAFPYWWNGTNWQAVGTSSPLPVAFQNATPIPGTTPIAWTTASPEPASAYTGSAGGMALPTACTTSVVINVSTAATTLLVATSAGTKVRVCDFSVYVVSGTLPSFLFEFGGGSTCTSPAAATGTYSGIAGAIGEHITVGTGLGTLFQGGIGQALCIVSAGTTPNLQGFLTYGQY